MDGITDLKSLVNLLLSFSTCITRYFSCPLHNSVSLDACRHGGHGFERLCGYIYIYIYGMIIQLNINLTIDFVNSQVGSWRQDDATRHNAGGAAHHALFVFQMCRCLAFFFKIFAQLLARDVVQGQQVGTGERVESGFVEHLLLRINA